MSIHVPCVDVKVMGAFGVDFNRVGLNTGDIEPACEKLGEQGVERFLAAVTTNEIETMRRLIQQIVIACDESDLVGDMISGIHIEGPFLSEEDGFSGVHPVGYMCDASIDKMEQLLRGANDKVRVVTLAPERDPGMKVTEFLSDKGIVVGAGHCNPSLEQLKAGVNSGLRLFTLLGNGCPQKVERHTHVVNRALATKGLMVSFIADGKHIPYYALGVYLNAAGLDRSIIVSNAMEAAGLGTGTFTIFGKQVDVGDDFTAHDPQEPGRLVASVATIPMIAEQAQDAMELSDEAMRTLVYDNPKRLLGI